MVQEIVEKQVDDNSDNLTEQEKEQIKEEKTQVKIISSMIQLKHHKVNKLPKNFPSGVTQMLSVGKHDSTPVYFSEEELKVIDELQEDNFKCSQ